MTETVKKDIAVSPNVRKYDIEGKGYIVKSVFIGDKDIKSIILKLAEQKAIKEMRLDNAVI